MSVYKHITDPSLAIIFATSPTGLGHLRVTRALSEGLPQTVAPALLGAQDQTISNMYRFISLNPLTRRTMERMYYPPFDKAFVNWGRKLLRADTKTIYQEFRIIMSQRLTVPQTVLLIAPHAILGHKLGAIKEQLAKEFGVQIILIVQVTDDSSQPFWYIPEADMTFVPSEYTKAKLQVYVTKMRFPQSPITVAAYPISPLFAQKLTDEEFASRTKQVDPQSRSTIHMTVPVSGAAVGTTQLYDYVFSLHCVMERVRFHVVSREAPFTNTFIRKIAAFPFVQLSTSKDDRTTLEHYEQVFADYPISLEITKPSEQSFKVLSTPRERGGAILLFASPVGGQEYDNLRFMRSHGFIPNKEDTKMLWQLAKKQASVRGRGILERAHLWRGFRLPDHPTEASGFTNWCHQQGIFAAMMEYGPKVQKNENMSNGVEQFWRLIDAFLGTKIIR